LPYTSPPPPQVQHPYAPYSHHSAASSSASRPNSQYTNTSQYAPWDTPNSSTSTFSNAQGQGQGQGEAQGRKWHSGGYEGEGYG
jgi:hypothetical protein